MKNCLCHLSPVFKGETDPSRQKDRVKKGGDEWLGELSHHERCRVLGVEGAKAWENGQGDWRESMRGYSAAVMGTRLTETVGHGKIQSMKRKHTNLYSEDITKEYLSDVTPYSGSVEIPDGYNQNSHKNEIVVASWLHKNIGGTITLLNEKNMSHQKTPDYLWRDKFWDLKSITTEKAADSAIRHGLKQIADNPGGLILDYKGERLDEKKLADIIEDRLSRGFNGTIDILVVNSGVVQFIKRYKRR